MMSNITPFSSLALPERLWGTTRSSADEVNASPRRMAVDLLRLFLANRTPIMLWGPVGARKTRSIEGLAREKDANGVPYQVITIQPSTMDPTVIHGILYTAMVDGQTIMRRSIPDIAKQVVDYHKQTGGYTILFLDELTTASGAQQAALLGLLTHAKFEGIDISQYITIVLAANPDGTVSTVNELSEAVINRGGHIAWYGDVELFLEEWSSGFGDRSRAPEPRTAWFVKSLIQQAPDEAFRNPENWQVETLVPYDQMEHSERVVTEFASMLELVNEAFAASPTGVRHAYIVEVTRALMGPKWAERAALVATQEAEGLSPDAVTRDVFRRQIDLMTPVDVFQQSIADRALHVLPTGEPLRADQASVLLDDMVARVLRDGFSKETYIAAWAFAVGAPTQGQVMAAHGQMIQLLRIAEGAVQEQLLPAREAVPAFVGSEVRDFLRAGVAA